LTKTIPPEGVDCNGIDPNIGYTSGGHFVNYDVYQLGGYPMDPSYIFTFNNHNVDVSSVFKDNTKQTQSLVLDLYARPGNPTLVYDEPCEPGTDNLPHSFGIERIDQDPGQTGYLTNAIKEFLSNSSDYKRSEVMISTEEEDDVRLEEKLNELQNDIEGLEIRTQKDADKQQLISTYIKVVQNLINDGAKCLNFDGVNDFVETSTPILDNVGSNNFTFEAWINADESTIGSHPVILCNRANSSNGMKLFFHDVWGTSSVKMLAVQLEGVNYFIEHNGTFKGSLLDNTCHHVAVTREENTLSFYADGILFGTRIISGNPDITTGLNLRIGSDRSNDLPFKGTISDVRVWDDTRTALEIFESKKVNFMEGTPNLIANWTLNEGSGQNVINHVSNLNSQLGRSEGQDNNDPSWSNNCCNDSMTIAELESRKIMLQAEYSRLESEKVALQEIVETIEINKAEIEVQGYYPMEPAPQKQTVFVRDGEIIGGPTYRVNTGGGIIIDPFDPDIDPPTGPCAGSPPKIAGIFHFQLELIVNNGVGGVGYVNPDGSGISSTPVSFSIFPELYRTCECDYYWNATSLPSLSGITLNNQELMDYPGEIQFNLKAIWVAKSVGGGFSAFDPNDKIHQFAQFMHFWTDYTHSTAPKTDDNISHSMENTYEYDVLNQLISEKTSDKGLEEMVIDEQGKLRFNQNAQQEIDKNFSYFNYDRAGRPIESGVYDYTSISAVQFQNNKGFPTLSSGTSVLTVLNEYDGLDNTYCSEQNYLMYDVADITSSLYYPFSTSSYTSYKQENLLGRISKRWNENSVIWYSYDMYGRTIWTVEYIVDLAEYKTIHYQYDASGNIIQTIYQKDNVEYFEHKNTYDNGQKLTKVETSVDASNYDEQVHYEYYQHGALKRTVLGGNLQGIDNVYTLSGRLKSINSPNLGSNSSTDFNDPGNDNPGNNGVYTDVFGMTVDYHVNDYVRSGTYVNYGLGNNEKFTETISGVRWNLDAPSIGTDLSASDKQNMYEYEYNDFNWLKTATFGEYINGTGQNNNSGNPLPHSMFIADANNQFKVAGITYDKNGNIETLMRNGNTTTGIAMDLFTYNYTTSVQPADGDVVKLNNQLTYLNDGVGTTAYPTDIESQGTGNYTYNVIGELISDGSENSTFTYFQNGLAKEVFEGGILKLKFVYNSQGFRIKKEIYTGGILTKEVYYIRNLAGTVASVYSVDVQAGITIKDYTLLGLNQLGSYDPVTAGSRYHVYDYLGNVRATIRENLGDIELLSASDFYPFGTTLPGRNIVSSVNKTNYGYQGKELDENNFYDFEARQWDGRLGRWITTDPAAQYYSPYLGMGNNPVSMIDPDGRYSYDFFKDLATAIVIVVFVAVGLILIVGGAALGGIIGGGDENAALAGGLVGLAITLAMLMPIINWIDSW